MFKSLSKFVFLGADVVKKEKNGIVNEYRFIRFADPVTFENHQLMFSSKCKVDHLNKGDQVHVTGSLNQIYGRSQFLVESVDKVN